MRIGIMQSSRLRGSLPPLRLGKGRGVRTALVSVALLTLCGCSTVERPPAVSPTQPLGLRVTAATLGTLGDGGSAHEENPSATPSKSPIQVPTATATASWASRQSGFDGARALRFVSEQVAFGPRVPGTEAHTRTAEWIQRQLEMAGWPVEAHPFSYQDVDLTNIVAHSQSTSGKWIILGAHYDTRPEADQDLNNPLQPVPGANDGASGVAVLLELANDIPPESLSCKVWMAFFDAEDSGGIDGWDWFLGSTHLAESLETAPEAVVVVDMVGDADLHLYVERNSNRQLVDEIWGVAADLGHDAFIPEPKWTILDDHIPFLRRGMPAADLIDFDYPYWHTTQDTLDKVSAESLAQVGETLAAWLTETCR